MTNWWLLLCICSHLLRLLHDSRQWGLSQPERTLQNCFKAFSPNSVSLWYEQKHCCCRTTHPLWHKIAELCTFPLMIRTRRSKIKQSTRFLIIPSRLLLYCHNDNINGTHDLNSSNSQNNTNILSLVKLLISLRVWHNQHTLLLYVCVFQIFSATLTLVLFLRNNSSKSVFKCQNRKVLVLTFFLHHLKTVCFGNPYTVRFPLS